MEMKENFGFGTKAIHAGIVEDKNYGALAVPIYQSSTFVFDSCAQGAARFAGEEKGYIYTRLGNPTTNMLEDKLACLEHGEACAATSSGMGAISSALWTALNAGDHIIADKVLYGCTHALIGEALPEKGIEVTMIDTTDYDALKSALQENTKVVYLETPANPTLKIIDIQAVADIVHGYNPEIMVMCDNTFCSPYLANPLDLGADVVVHSGTKYLNGHGDVVCGFVVGSAEFVGKVKMKGIKDMTGSVLPANESFLVMRGMKTLELRMQRHCSNAMTIAQYLEKHPKVVSVFYPGLESFEGHEIAKKQMHNGFGGMITFEVTGGREAGSKFVEALKLCTLAVSLGDAETLVEHAPSMTHSAYSAEELADAGISEGQIRFSVGLENVEDIIADIEQALEQI